MAQTTRQAPKINEQTTTVKGRIYTRYVVDYGKDDKGNRKRKTFKSREEAEADVKSRLKRMEKLGRQAKRLDDCDMRDAAAALDLLQRRTTLQAAVRFWLTHNDTPGGNKTVKEAVQEYIAEAEADNLRPASRQDMQNRLGRFAAAFGERPLSTITKADVQAWLKSKHTAKRDGSPIAPLTRRHYMTVVGGLFNFAVEQEYIAENPLARKSRRRRSQNGMEDERMPGILTPAEVEKVLFAAVEHEPSMVPALALGFFAGVRTNEIRQLDWSNVNLADKRVTIPPAIAKRRSVRHIDMADNLMAWLAPYAKEHGRIAPAGTEWRYRFDKVREKAEVTEWPHNAARHSFATYHLAGCEDANKTALQLGHRGGTNLLFNHYRGLTTREDAARFWKITPKAAGQVLRFAAAG
ncbi:MAG: tyrosine-type recombinase/integrase [Verrucomicrobia bacterium]|nr:tyrosine-type recombinase/integrase [Verrucomicrobiota bacterium]